MLGRAGDADRDRTGPSFSSATILPPGDLRAEQRWELLSDGGAILCSSPAAEIWPVEVLSLWVCAGLNISKLSPGTLNEDDELPMMDIHVSL